MVADLDVKVDSREFWSGTFGEMSLGRGIEEVFESLGAEPKRPIRLIPMESARILSVQVEDMFSWAEDWFTFLIRSCQ